MVDINWEEAPEGTTHHLESVRFGSQYWLKREGDHYRWRNVPLGHLGYPEGRIVRWPATYDNPELYTLTERPLKEPELPDGFRWEDAPEGTTHFIKSVKFGGTYWLKKWADRHTWRSCKAGEKSAGYPNEDAPWVDYDKQPDDWLLIEREPQAPQVVVINGVEVDWGKAPEGTTHAATDLAAIRAYGQWRKLENNTVSDWKRGEWVARNLTRAEEWKRTNHGQFIEKPGLVAGVKKEQAAPVKVAPKKPIGWWS